MTNEKFEKAKELSYKIKETKARIKDVNALLNRYEEIYGKDKYAEIRLKEDWVYTPFAYVDSEDFSAFLQTQISRYKTELKFLQQEFDRL